MKDIPEFTTVIHVKDDEQALQQTRLALENGADGVFLIDHKRKWPALTRTLTFVRAALPDAWLGVNYLDLTPDQSVALCASLPSVNALWLDDSRLVDLSGLRELQNMSCKVFAGTAFKYQPQPDDLEQATHEAAARFDVVCTSGPATGEQPALEKLAVMRKASSKPIALASGVTADNAASFVPYVDCFTVASGVSVSFHELDAQKVRELADIIHVQQFSNHEHRT